MRMRHKPIVGTTLVPNVRNIEGCFKYGGKWDREHKVCIAYERQDGHGCTAPINGISICWETLEGDTNVWMSQIYIAPWHANDQGEDYNLEGYEEGYTTEEEAIEGGKDIAVKWVKEHLSELHDGLAPESMCCYSPRGRVIGCNEPNAILDWMHMEKEIAAEYRNILKLKEIDDFIKKRKRRTSATVIPATKPIRTKPDYQSQLRGYVY